MKKKYELKFNTVDDLKNFFKEEKDVEFKPPIAIKTLITSLTETELKAIVGSYNVMEFNKITD